MTDTYTTLRIYSCICDTSSDPFPHTRANKCANKKSEREKMCQYRGQPKARREPDIKRVFQLMEKNIYTTTY